jgi:SAM-dependent methyltransferase
MKESQKIIDILVNHNLHGFDKVGGTDKGTIHTYTGSYEIMLTPYVEKDITLLEVGVQYGGSSLLWQEFLPKAKMALVDITDQMGENVKEKLDMTKHKYYVMDAYHSDSLERIKKDFPDGFDVMIDDGPHTLESQISFIVNYSHLLKPGGILIIEDIQNFSAIDFLKFNVPEDLKNYVEVLDLRHYKNRYDDLMFIIKKPLT